jgi:hypothetical protein
MAVKYVDNQRIKLGSQEPGEIVLDMASHSKPQGMHDLVRSDNTGGNDNDSSLGTIAHMGPDRNCAF